MKISHSDYAREHITEVPTASNEEQAGEIWPRSLSRRNIAAALLVVVVVSYRGEVLEKSQTALVLGAFLHFGIIQWISASIEIYIHKTLRPHMILRYLKRQYLQVPICHKSI